MTTLKIPTELILVENSKYKSTNSLKRRLYKENLKQPICELCGQNETWRGKYMSLILDHINGIKTDNRIENLQIVCPNCNATLSTFSGKNVKNKKIKTHKYCQCGNIIGRRAKSCLTCISLSSRKLQRPSYEQLQQNVKEYGYSGTGKIYGVSDNAIRKWIKYYIKKNMPEQV
jgi:hypothetical protein